MHLAQRYKKGELHIIRVDLEGRPTSNDLQARQGNLADVHVADEDVARHLADVLQEAQVQVLLLEPCQLQVAVDVRAVGIPVTEVSVVVVPVRGDGHAAVGADADCNTVTRQITTLPKN